MVCTLWAPLSIRIKERRWNWGKVNLYNLSYYTIIITKTNLFVKTEIHTFFFFYRKAFSPQLILGSGVVIGAGSEDHRIWAHNIHTGEELWQSDELEHDATSLPMTYKLV